MSAELTLIITKKSQFSGEYYGGSVSVVIQKKTDNLSSSDLKRVVEFGLQYPGEKDVMLELAQSLEWCAGEIRKALEK